MPEWTILKILQWTTGYFSSHQIDSPRVTAEILLAHCLGIQRIDLYLRHDQPLNQNELAAFKSLVRRRIHREPVAYITGEKSFWSLDLRVTSDVLIPRPDTECLVDTAIGVLPRRLDPDAAALPRTVLDMGTGSGAIVLSLARERPGHIYFATDISFRSLTVARNNARRFGMESHIHFLVSDWLSAFAPGRIRMDLIVCNPPYIPSGDIETLEPEIRCHEPRLALDGSSDGLEPYRRILQQATSMISPAGTMLLEIGWNQKEAILEICRQFPEYRRARIIQDDAGHDRVLRLDMDGGAPLS